MASSFSPILIQRVSKSAYSLREKTLVLNVHDALVHQNPSSSVRDIITNCANMIGVGESTIYRFVRERKSRNLGEPIPHSGRKPLEIDDVVKNSVRRIVHGMYFAKEIPTVDKIVQAAQNDENLPQLSRTTVWRILRGINFRWEKQNRKSFLIDKPDIVCWRRGYLRSIRKYRNEGKNIFYLDETWLNEGHTVSKIWQDKNILSSRQAVMEGWSTGLRLPSGKGRRLIITHIGSENGFLDQGLLEFQSNSSKDYHEEMTADVFEEYFQQMIEYIPQNSVIVMDNASYHSRLVEKLPTSSWKKAAMIEWLQCKALNFDDTMVKTELLQVVRQHKAKFKKFVIDEMAKGRGIIVHRLPPYHCELNPIELIWAQVKGYVARNNNTFKLQEVRQLLMDSLANVTAENWQSAIKHVIAEEEKMWDLDGLIDETTEIEPVIINLGEDDSSDFSDEEFSS